MRNSLIKFLQKWKFVVHPLFMNGNWNVGGDNPQYFPVQYPHSIIFAKKNELCIRE